MWKLAGWVTVIFSVGAALVGLLLLIGGMLETENRLDNMVAGAVMIFGGFSLGRVGWSLRTFGEVKRDPAAPPSTDAGPAEAQSKTTRPPV